ncbi:MAG TPA: deoxyribonuclease V [Chloroflexota bacterium]|nr:deoxyribonuclease V [Chloroflexota bacterium]
MKARELNAWNVSPGEAVTIQNQLAPFVIRDGSPRNVRLVAGIDVALPDAVTRAAVVIDSFPALSQVACATADCPIGFPYVPGLLSFREAPAIIAACAKITTEPDLVIVDGQGIAHPRHLGIASHIGLILDLPTIGCAKSLLVGTHEPVGEQRGDWQPITYKGQVIGAALRTRLGTKPLYVSIGNKISLESAIHWVIACCGRYRLPEPQRQAHHAAGSS